ncbi:MAG TPA: nucleoside triphosphate pyrophosphohydrolase [Spirochaetota bacterium]|nr:nucleoside triphosphate pyrophosphohydrolase [Spirochaetota bacterium]
MKNEEKNPLIRLKEIAAILRAENGCPWDREQDFVSLKPYLIEEAYEVIDAIDKNDMTEFREELGDLLYQVYAHAQIAAEESLFTVEDVAQGIVDKLVRRHPHVFGDEDINDSKGVKDRWEKIKKEEKAGRRSVLAGIPRHLPALTMASRVQEKVSHVGFDWEKIDDAILKIDEELEEFKEAVSSESNEKMKEEAGDILFSIVNVLRFRGIDPEDALRGTVNKFMKRFSYIEEKSAEQGKSINSMTLEEMDSLWEDSKKKAL